jgi:uncharacterized protein (TIGR03067 family)
MRTLLAAVLGVVVLATGRSDNKKVEAGLEDVKFDADKLYGTWKITGGKKGGTDATDDAKKTVVTISKDKLVMEMKGPMGDMKFEFKYTIDAKVTPVAVDLEITEGPIGKGEKRKGILELKGDDLKLAYPPEEGDRPAKFDDGKSHSFTLKKDKAEKKEEKKEEKKVEEKKVATPVIK